MELRMLYFNTTVGASHEQIPFETVGSVKFFEVVYEIGKKLGLAPEAIAIAPPGQAALTATELQYSVDDVIKNYGASFQIINRGIVGM